MLNIGKGNQDNTLGKTVVNLVHASMLSILQINALSAFASGFQVKNCIVKNVCFTSFAHSFNRLLSIHYFHEKRFPSTSLERKLIIR